MPIKKEELEKLIKSSIPDANIIIEDLRGDGDHYSATIISKSFVSPLETNCPSLDWLISKEVPWLTFTFNVLIINKDTLITHSTKDEWFAIPMFLSEFCYA